MGMQRWMVAECPWDLTYVSFMAALLLQRDHHEGCAYLELCYQTQHEADYLRGVRIQCPNTLGACMEGEA